MHPDVKPPEIKKKKNYYGVLRELISTRTKTLLDIYFNVIMGRYDFKTALEVAVQFFPGIKLNYKERTEIVPRNPAFQTKRRPPQVFAGISDWLFH